MTKSISPGEGERRAQRGYVRQYESASAAIYAALVTGILRSLASQELGPAEMLRALNKALLKRPIRGRFVSLIYVTWDERNRRNCPAFS